MSAAEAVPEIDPRTALESRFLAGVLWCGAPAFAPLMGFEAGVLSPATRYAFEAAKELVGTGEATAPIPPDAVMERVQRHASAEVTASVREAVELALEVGGAPAPADVGRMGHALADLDAAQPEATKPRPRTKLLEVSGIFARLPPVSWLCQALDMAPGAPTLVAGYGFSGKTLAAQDLALAVATGTLAWGSFPVRPGRVLHVDYEQGSYLTRQRYQRLARARDIDPAELEGRLSLAVLPDWYLDSDTTDELTRLCEGVDLLIVDSFRAACPGTDENASDARIPLDRLGRISEATGTTPLVIHHARKPSKDSQGGARMSVRGSGALYDACGSVLVFGGEKGEPVSVTHEKARISGRPHEDFRLVVEDVEIDGDPDAGLRVSSLSGSASTRAPDRFTELKGRVLELVREEGAFVGGVNLLRSRLGAKKEDVGAAIADLEKAGAILRGGTYHRPTFSCTGTDGDSQC